MAIFFIIGVSGCGKSTVGNLLAKRLGCTFFDGDDFHSPANIAKMQAGIALSDEDRADWLAAIHHKASEMFFESKASVFACSALKKKYRDILVANIHAHFVLLDGSYERILERLQQREGHYMPTALLQSQFDILERSGEVFVINIEQEPDQIVHKIISHFDRNGND